MKQNRKAAIPTDSKPNSASEPLWVKTPFANLVRYVPSGSYFARIKVKGKLVRQSLKTKTLSVAKLRLADLEKSERQQVISESGDSGKMSFGNALQTYLRRLEADQDRKPSLRKYRLETVKAILTTWPGIEKTDVRKIGERECEDWADRLRQQYSPHRFNNTVGTFRHVLDIAVRAGNLYRNPGCFIKKAKVRITSLVLPEADQFVKFVESIRNGHSRDSRNCSDLVQFLAFGGFRKSEAAAITWADCDFAKGEIIVRGDPATGTKNWDVRRVPMIPDMRKLLERLQTERHGEPDTSSVMRVRECQKAMDRAAKAVGFARITHHDLRHLFATRCIESGVDVPAVSRWLGHKDGGALAMKVYGHLRDEHSTNMAQKVTFGTVTREKPQSGDESVSSDTTKKS
jgi:integrase